MAVPTVNGGPLAVPEWEVLDPSAHLLGAGALDFTAAVLEAEGSQEGEAEDSQEAEAGDSQEGAAWVFQEEVGEAEDDIAPG
ncbi:MAG: hypothetical protein ACXU97_08605 [Thermodesulfobacteriota bacterium]